MGSKYSYKTVETLVCTCDHH